MNEWKQVRPELAARFLAVLPDAADVERRKMFGCPCAFVNGNMFAGLHEDRLLVRLPDEAAGRPCVIMGRTMRQYALFPNALELAPKAFSDWLKRSYELTRSLAPKPAKPAKSSAKAPKAARPAAKPGMAAKAMKAAGTAKAAKVAKATPAEAAKETSKRTAGKRIKAS